MSADAVSSSWLAPTQELRPAPPPRRAALPVGVIRVGIDPEPPQPPPAPTLEELRSALADAIETKRLADAVAAIAMAARDRATALVQARQSVVAGFADLDAKITHYTVDALRERGTSTELPADLISQRAARDAAVANLAAAEAALATLTDEWTAAQGKAQQAGGKATMAAVAVLNHLIVSEVIRYRRAVAEVEARFKTLAAYDAFLSPITTPPFVVIGELRNEPVDHRHLFGSPTLNTGRWRSALAALLADPLATIELETEKG